MNTWGPISAVLHVTTIVAVIVLFGDYHFVDPSLYKVAKDNSGAEALNIASQMGRLDLVSLVLDFWQGFFSRCWVSTASSQLRVKP